MDITKCQQFADKISELYNYPKVKIILTNNISAIGECYYWIKEIHLNKRKCEAHTEKYVYNLIKHEIVHLKYPDHSLNFTKECRNIGTHQSFSINGYTSWDTKIPVSLPELNKKFHIIRLIYDRR